uniref:Synergin gamma-like n=1 Tax=Callorhinchus milii TaxID=7868 RepID=A0A4W3HJG7_CALMI
KSYPISSPTPIHSFPIALQIFPLQFPFESYYRICFHHSFGQCIPDRNNLLLKIISPHFPFWFFYPRQSTNNRVPTYCEVNRGLRSKETWLTFSPAQESNPSLLACEASALTTELQDSVTRPNRCVYLYLSCNLTGVTEVYRVAKRVEGGIKARGISDEMLQQSLRDIEIAWNNLQAFLSFSPPVLRMLPSESTFDCSGETAMAGSENAQAESCGVCLLSILPGFNGLKHAENLLTYQGGHFHASCANLWLNCVDSNLPALTVSPQTSVDSKPPAVTEPNGTAADSNLLPFTVPPQNRNDPNFKSLPIATSP